MKIIIYNKSDCTDDVALEMIGKSLSKEIDLRGRWTTTYFTIQSELPTHAKR